VQYYSLSRTAGIAGIALNEHKSNRFESMQVGIVVERRDSSHPWADHVWQPVAVIPGAPPMDPTGPWKILKRGNGREQYLAGTLDIEVWRTDTEAYLACLTAEPPQVFIVLREDLEGEHEYVPFLATVSAYEAQDYADGGDDIVEGVPMPEEVIAWVQAFVDAHHVDKPFKKRRFRGKKKQTEPETKPRYGRGSGWSEGHEF